MDVGFYYVSVALSSNGLVALSYNLRDLKDTFGCPAPDNAEDVIANSTLFSQYNNGPPFNLATATNCGALFLAAASAFSDVHPSVVVPADSLGRMRVSYVFGMGRNLGSVWFNGSSRGATENIAQDSSNQNFAEFSAVSDADYGTHLIYRTLGNTAAYAYHAVNGSGWTDYSYNVFSRSVTSPTITTDYSTGDVYAFAINGSSIAMKRRPTAQRWEDQSVSFPVVGRKSPAYLGSNFASASTTNSSQVLMIWTEGAGPYNATFASIPMQTVWSPYGSPSDPWDGNGLSPFGQYFANLGEYVSPSTGALTVRQTDLNTPGRGLDLDIARVYVEPASFLFGSPYNYESYPWAPLGNGWQLNFPWMNNTSKPFYIHLRDGEGYRIPSSFWSVLPSTFENHQGEHFRMVRNSTGIFLYAKSGISYKFDPNNSSRLTKILDPIGNNVTFTYDGSNRISCITDALQRNFLLAYTSGLLMSISQTTGACTGGGTTVRQLLYSYSGTSLTSVTDHTGRRTSYQYAAVSGTSIAPWLLSRIVYPTGWYTSYTYTSALMGTEATSYPTYRQTVNSTTGSSTRWFQYNYTRGPGDQVTNSTIRAYDATSSQPVSYTTYAFAFDRVGQNVSNANHNFVRGTQQRFGVHGEVPREIVLVSPTLGYTNYYSYDLWGNLIFSRRAINSTANLHHESFNSYYNNGLSPGFNAFQETFGQGNFTGTDNPWSVQNGYWMVKNGRYNGTETSGQIDSIFSWSDIGKADISLQARLYIGRVVNTTVGLNQVGIFVHYPGHGSSRWALILDTSGAGLLQLVDEQGTRYGSPTCTSPTGAWYTLNMTVSGYQVSGWAQRDGQPRCDTGTWPFPSNGPAAKGTGFGLYAGGYSTLFDNVTVATVAPFITNKGFSNSFILNGAPGANVHSALAGTAELMNGTGTTPLESYYSYTPWGGLAQTNQRYDASPTQWLTTTRTYDSFGNPKVLTDPRGNMTYYVFSGKYQSAYPTNLTAILIPGSSKITTLHGYNFTMGTRVWTLDPQGHNTTYTYDILGRRTRINYPDGDFVSYKHNDTANYVDITNENGWKTLQIYDGLGRLSILDRFLAGKSYSNETTTSNWQNNVATQKDALGNVYTYQYDPLGRTVRVVKPDGNTTQLVYDDVNSRVRSIDENSVSRCNNYDRLGRLISVVEEATATCQPGITTNYYYDEVGNLARVINAKGQATTYVYDNLNRLSKTSYSDSTSESYSYDNNGNLVSKIDRKLVQTVYAYDSLNRLSTITYRASPVTIDSYIYDRNGNLLQLQNQNATITYTYDWRNRVASEAYSVNGGSVGGPAGTGGGGGSVAAGTLITLANGTSVPVQRLQVGMSLLSYNITTSRYQVSTITLMQVVYTSNMLVIRTRDPLPLRVDNATAQKLYVKQSGGTVSWLSVTQLRVGDSLFNALDQRWTQVTSIEKAPSGIHVMYDIYTTAPYDYIANGYLDPPKRPQSGTATLSSSSSSSTSGGTLANGYSFTYAYTGEVLSQIMYSDFFAVVYSYDSLGRVLNVNQSSTASYARFTYYRNDRVMGIKYGNGLQANYTYDTLSRVQHLQLVQPGAQGTTTPLLTLDYQYNKDGTPASVMGYNFGTCKRLDCQGVSEKYTYDLLHRLTNATLLSGGLTTSLWYEYDSLGNRARQSLNGITSYAYNPSNNELVSSNSAGTTTAYTYDANGNLVSRSTGTASTWNYTWDASNRLVSAGLNGAAQGFYAYDGMGRRVESMEGSTSTFYAYYGTETLYEQTLAPSITITDYVYAAGLRIARVTGGSTLSPTLNYYHTDALGSTRLVTDPGGKVLFSDNYQPFGQDNTSSGSETYKFTGKPVSQTTGLYYYYHRWYDPSIGRFISPDPKQGKLSSPQSLNLYIYVLDRPTSLTDPMGEDWWNPLTWNQQQQAQAFTIAVIALAVVAVIATGGLASPLALAAVGAAISTTTYTVAAGNKATLVGAITSAAIGAIGGGTTGVVAGIAGAAGLGSMTSLGLGLAASFGTSSLASTLARHVLGPNQGNSGFTMSDNIQSLNVRNRQELAQMNKPSLLPNGQSPQCQAAVGAGFLMGATGILLLDASAHVIGSSDDWRVNAAGFAMLGVGMSLPVAGLLYANSQCTG